MQKITVFAISRFFFTGFALEKKIWKINYLYHHQNKVQFSKKLCIYFLEDSCAGFELGDINQDSLINILDVTGLVNIDLGLVDADDCQLQAADLNLDSTINILDILALVNLILGLI